jgi:CP family cyanate transporter-like MFS transporter
MGRDDVEPGRDRASAAVRPARTRTFFTLVALLLVAVNLRLAIAAIGPVLDEMRTSLTMSHGVAGLLTTLPLVCFGLLAPAAAYVGGRIGSSAALVAALVALTVGIALRSVGGTGAVLVATVLIGAGVAVGNVLVPVVIKSRLQHAVGLAMGLYTALLTTGAAIGAVAAAGLAAAGWGWRAALALDAIPALIAIAVFVAWWLTGRGESAPAAPVVPRSAGFVWRAGAAWQLAVFMGGQSLLFYSFVSWLPAMLQSRGVSVATSGAMLSLYSILGIVGALVMPPIAARARNPRGPLVVSVAGWSIGVAGLWLLPDWYVLWSVELGVTQGAGIALALMMIVTLSRDTAVARHMSGMVQMVGYLLAAVGPWLFGVLRDQTHSWVPSLLMLLVMSALMMAAAYLVAKARPVG